MTVSGASDVRFASVRTQPRLRGGHLQTVVAEGSPVARVLPPAAPFPELMRHDVRSDDIVHITINRGAEFISDIPKDAPYLLAPREDNTDGRPRFAKREHIKSCAILPLKAPPDGEIVGCLFVNYREPKDFLADSNQGLKALALSVASAVAVGIKVARLSAQVQTDLERTKAELNAVGAINRSIARNAQKPDLKQTCDELLAQANKVLGTTVGDVTIWNPREQRLDVVSQKGYPNDGAVGVQLGQGLVGIAAKTRERQYLDDVTTAPDYRRIHPETRSEIAFPMLDEERGLLGVINVEHQNECAFPERAQVFLDTLAVQGAIAVHGVFLHQQLQLQLRQAKSLGAIAARIQDAQSEQDQVSRETAMFSMLLAGLTARQGLQFSRAMLFLPRSDDNHFVGAMAVGALSRDEALKTWHQIDADEAATQSGEDFLERLLDEATQKHDNYKNTPLSMAVKKIVLDRPLGKRPTEDRPMERNISLECLNSDDHNPLCRQLATLYPKKANSAIMVVPIGRVRPLALIVLDRCFLHDPHIIDEKCAPTVRAFAELAAISIESSRLRALQDWRWASHKIAHCFKRTFSSLEQSKSRLSGLLASNRDHSVAEALEDLGKMLDSMRDLEKDLNRFGHPADFCPKEVELVSTVEEIVTVHRNIYSCKPVLQPSSHNIVVQADRSHLKTILMELLTNADRALTVHRIAQPTITIEVSATEGEAKIAVRDNGPGVTDKIRDRLWEPFVSGYESTGLGLAVVWDSVEKHGGSIEYRFEDPGACFTVSLPCRSQFSDQRRAAS